MTSAADTIRAIATSLAALASSVEEIPTGGSEPALPPAIDCLAGTWPTQTIPYPISYPSSDVPSSAIDLNCYDRTMALCHDGTIGVWGDSLVQAMVAGKISPFVQTFGVGGETLRRCFNRLARGGLIHRAGAVVLATGINELANFACYAPYTADQITNNLAFMHSGLAAQATGKWVIRDILPIDEPVWVAINISYSGMNAKIDLANQRIRAAWATSAAQVEFVPLKDQLVDGAGNLADAYHIDGLHLNRDGDDIQCTGIKAALRALGVI